MNWITERSISVAWQLLWVCENSRQRLFLAYVLAGLFALFDVATIFILFRVFQGLQHAASSENPVIILLPSILELEFAAAICFILVVTAVKLMAGMLVTWFRANAVFRCQEELQYLFLASMGCTQNFSGSAPGEVMDEKEAVSVVTIDTGLFNSAAYAFGTLIIDVLSVVALVFFLAFTVSWSVLAIIGGLLILVHLTFFGLRRYQEAWATSRLKAETRRISAVAELYRLNQEFPWGVPQVTRSTIQALLLAIRRAGSNQAILQLFPRLYIEFIFLLPLGFFAIFLAEPEALSEYSDSFVALALAAFRALPSISKIFSSFNSLRNAQAGCDRLLTMLRYEESNSRVKLAATISRYPQLERIKLRFDQRQAGVIGLFGRSGTGKSTFLRALHSYALETGRASCYLPPNPVLIAGSIWDNICPHGGDINAAAEHPLMAKIFSSSDRLRIKNMTLEVQENGRNFSSGERQRIAIARAITACNDLIILDENLSNIDVTGAISIVDSFKSFKPHGMVVVVSHNRELLRNCDEIIEI
ncbi:ATP-binding cassette domain-containing protein [Luminiphilus sp.]|nr:ATP-binding cassette domain-containing protein [Luminiphilus sp.]